MQNNVYAVIDLKYDNDEKCPKKNSNCIKRESVTEENNCKKKRALIRKQMKIRKTMEENKRDEKGRDAQTKE